MEFFGTAHWGQMDLAWVAYYLFPAQYLGLKYKPDEIEKLNLWVDIGKSCGWWWPYENICIISDRPKKLSFDDAWQLDCEDGPAILFRDGYSVYSTHGVRHEGWFIEHPEQITVDKIAAEENADIRRVMIAKMGHAKYLHETGAVEIHSDCIPIGGGVEGFVQRSLLRDKHNEKFLCGHDGSTEHIYFMSCDPEAKTCAQAHESISGFKDDLIISNA